MVLNIVIVVIVVGVLYATCSEITKNVVTVEPFQLPEQFQQKGYTGRIVASQVIDQCTHIAESSFARSEQALLGTWAEQNRVQIQVPGMGISLDSLRQLLRQLVGKTPLTISGEIIMRDQAGNFTLTLRISGEPAQDIAGHTDDVTPALFQAAHYIMKQTQPSQLGRFKLLEENDPDGYSAALKEISKSDITPDEYRLWGLVLMEQGQYKEAGTKFRTLIFQYPSAQYAYIDWAEALLYQKKYQAAIAKIQKALEMDSDWDYAHVVWAKVLAHQKKFQEALQKLEEARKITPKARNYNPVGDIYLMQRRYQEATATFELCIQANHSCRHYAWRLATFPDSVFRDGEKAIKFAQQAVEDSSDLNYFRIRDLDTLAAAYAEQGRFDEAIRTLEKAQANVKLTKRQREHLEQYQQHQPWREEIGDTYR